MANRVTLTLVLTLSFLSYMAPELNESVQLAPLALFASLVLFKVLWSKSILDTVWSLFELDGLVYVLFLSVLMIAPSLASGSGKLIQTAFVITGCLLLARLYMTLVPVQEVLEAFFWSGVVSIAVFIPLSFAGLLKSIETLDRFWVFSFHPNLLAFLLAGYFCSMVWKFLTCGWPMKALTGFLGVACLTIIFFSSSRGSIVGLLAAGAFACGIVILGSPRESQKKIIRLGLVATLALSALALLIWNLAWVQDTSSFIDQVLQLTQSDRGLGSGFSGRFNNWNTALRVLSDGTWLLGHGVRSSDLMPEGSYIDNSYLVALYEIGFVALCLIAWRFLHLLRRFSTGYLQATNDVQRRLSLACMLLLACCMVNNIVARYLFSVGNPYSLVVLMLFATPTRVIVSGPNRPQSADFRGIGALEAHT